MTPHRLRITRAVWLAGALAAVGAALYLVSPVAHATEVRVAGFAFLDYEQTANKKARPDFLSGFIPELALKGNFAIREDISVVAKICYGCHRVEVDRFYGEVHVTDWFNVRFGRIDPAFGEFPFVHDAVSRKLASEPLPYSHGRMVRGEAEQFNLGVLPIPYVDTGAEISGAFWPTDTIQLWYAVHGVTGMRGTNDVDFRAGRTQVLGDNNSLPGAGGKLSLSFTELPGAWDSLTVGVSVMYGSYDSSDKLYYRIGAAHASTRIGTFNLRAEYLRRDTDLAKSLYPTAVQDSIAAGRTSDYMRKEGLVIEADYRVAEPLEVVARYDTLRRTGLAALGSTMDDDNGIRRYSAGVNLLFGGGAIVRLSYEFWDFTDFKDTHVAHVGVVAYF